MIIRFVPPVPGSPAGKLADVEIHFPTTIHCEACNGDGSLIIATEGPLAGAEGLCAECEGEGTLPSPFGLAGLKLMGFAIWQQANGEHRVTFPARQYSVGGERRSYALLRPTTDTAAQDRLRDQILSAFDLQGLEVR